VAVGSGLALAEAEPDAEDAAAEGLTGVVGEGAAQAASTIVRLASAAVRRLILRGTR
jgi:hypothetical protein